MSVQAVLAELKAMADPANVKGMARYGISSKGTLGVSVPALRKIAKKHVKDHALAIGLWDSGVHEARILASLVDDPRLVTESQMERWVSEIDSWDVCDGCCGNLFDRTPFAFQKAVEWSARKEEFVRRAGYVMMAELAAHDRAAPDSAFTRFFIAIQRGSSDGRNFVRKAVNWALRQIGKRNAKLNRQAVKVAERIARMESSSAKWVAADALRELRSKEVQKRLRSSS